MTVSFISFKVDVEIGCSNESDWRRPFVMEDGVVVSSTEFSITGWGDELRGDGDRDGEGSCVALPIT